MHPINYYFLHPNITFQAILEKYFTWLPDKVYLQILFWLKMGHRLNLKNPKTFSEKIQWLKLYNRRPEYSKMVDKYAVKEYVASKLGTDYIIPTLGVWNKPENIDWDNLPNEFVLKTTHGGGSEGVVICKDKTSFDKSDAIAKLNLSMKQDIYRVFKEWPYKNVPHRILAEKFISGSGEGLIDYKFFCFNGDPEYCQVISDRDNNMSIDFYDKDWNHQPFHEPKEYPFAKKGKSRPRNYDKMLKFAALLAEDEPFIRVDFYEIEDKVYFGEMTFYPTSGFGGFQPAFYDEEIGNMIKLPSIDLN